MAALKVKTDKTPKPEQKFAATMLAYPKVGCRAVRQEYVFLVRARVRLEGEVEAADSRYVVSNGEVGIPWGGTETRAKQQ